MRIHNVVTRGSWLAARGAGIMVRGTRRLAHGFSRNTNHESRVTICAIALPLFFLAAISDIPWLESFLRYVYMIIGFSVIIFVHELGHFLVARACKVNCPVFSVGMGHRLCGWKKGVGFTFGPQPDADDEKDKKDNLSIAEAATAAFSKSDDKAKPAGKTDYRISMLPIGGYVRMLGQDDMDPTKISSDPNSYNSKPIWQRMCIISAGVTMNIIFAVIIFAIVFKVGIDRPGPEVGRVQYGSPADKAGLKMGDRIVAANTEGVNDKLEFMDVMIASALSGGHTVNYSWHPYGDPGKVISKEITPAVNDTSGLLMIGVSPVPNLKFPALTKDELTDFIKDAPEFKDVHSGETITQFNGQPVKDYVELYRDLQATNGAPVTLTLHNDDPKIIPQDNIIQNIHPRLSVRDGVKDSDYPTIAGFIPRAAVYAVASDSPAEKAGIKPGDSIVRVNETENPTIPELIAAVAENAGNKVNIVVERNGKQFTLTPVPVKTANGGKILIEPVWDTDHPIIAAVAPDDAALKNVIPGSTIVAIDGTKMDTWNDVLAYVRLAVERAGGINSTQAAESSGIATTQTHSWPTLIFTIRPPVPASSTPASASAPALAATIDIAVPLRTVDVDDAMNKLEYNLGIPLEIKTELQKSDTIGGAVMMGLDGTRKFVIQTYLTLHGLVNGTIPASQLHGGLGIAKVGHDIQEKGFIHLLFLLGVISVNLAVANFLPLPIVDGGHFLLLIVEKIRGRRLAPKIELTIQYVGLCLIIGMLLFVTFNDLSLFFPKK